MDALKGNLIEQVERWGKEICFRFSNQKRLYIHLMLKGGFQLSSRNVPVEFPVLTIELDQGLVLAIYDPKGLAMVSLEQRREDTTPDALAVDAALLRRLIAKKPKAMVKALLIDQKIIRGIGNAYSDEILWKARVSPKSVAGRLSDQAVDALAEAIPSVLGQAIETIRRDRPGIIAGEYREFLSVHNPGRRESPTGHRIRTEMIASKKTYLTDEQVLYQ
jgi:formamidopyrimidine-DNA glycosylase